MSWVVQFRLHKIPLLAVVLRQFNLFHIVTSCALSIHLNIALPKSAHGYLKERPHFRFRDRYIYSMLATFPAHHLLLDT
jgi:hypothetical protein